MTSRIASTVLAVALAAGAVLCLVLGVDTRPSTGGLLLAPVPLTRLSGGWLLAAAGLATLAGLVALDARARWRPGTRPAEPGPP